MRRVFDAERPSRGRIALTVIRSTRYPEALVAKRLPFARFTGSPVEALEDALAEGISFGHPRMPEFRLEPGEVGDFISFLKSLECSSSVPNACRFSATTRRLERRPVF